MSEYKVDLNSDLGESFGAYTIGLDDQVLPLVTSANIACGFHASDPHVMAKTVGIAAANGVRIGAHPGFPDLVGFGRRRMTTKPGEVRDDILYQIGALDAFARVAGQKVRYVKPHGALYNMAEADLTLATEIVQAIHSYDPTMPIMSAYGSQMSVAAKAVGLPSMDEFFADRAYEEDGHLVSRSKPGAVLDDVEAAAARVVRAVKEGVVTAITGKDIPMHVDSVCVHGDSPQALAFVRRIREVLAASGIEITAG